MLVGYKNLRLEVKPSECRAVNDSVAVPVISAAVWVLAFGVGSRA